MERDRVVLIKKIGKGNQSQVHKAYHNQYDIIFALKCISSNQPQKNFKPQRQLQVSKRIKQNKNVIRLLEHHVGKTNNHYFFYQFCARSDLWKKIQLIAKQNYIKYKKVKYQLSQYTIYRILYQTLKGFKILHSQNIIHRDFKQQNIFIDAYGNFKIGDFGCAKIKKIIQIKERQIRETPQIGNKFYWAPQVQNFEVDQINTKSDIWGLGLLILHMITGEQFFNSKETQQKLKSYRQIQEIIEQKNHIFKGKWKQWKDIIKSMLKNKPSERSSAQQLLIKLEQTKKQRQKWFLSKYKIDFLIQDKIESKQIIQILNPYVQKQENIRIPKNFKQQFKYLQDKIKKKLDQEQVFLRLINIRQLLHFQIERLIQWYKIRIYQNVMNFASRKQSVIVVQYLCLKIFVFKILSLKNNMQSIIKKQDSFDKFYQNIQRNNVYKQVYENLLQKQSRTIDKKILELQKKILKIQVKYNTQLTMYKAIINTPDNKCQDLLRKLFYEQNKSKVQQLLSKIKKKKDQNNIIDFIQQKVYEKIKEQQSNQQKNIKCLKGHIHLHLLFHLDQYLQKSKWRDQQYIRVKTDNFQIYTTYQQLYNLYKQYR